MQNEISLRLSLFRKFWMAFMVVATSVPYVVNFILTPRGFHYTWILPPYPADSFGYMAWSQQAAHGSWLFKLKYTALPQNAFLFHPFFLVCGWISALFSCEVGMVHWAMKSVGVVLFFLVFYRYLDHLHLNVFQSVAASVLVGVSSGLGWVWILLGLSLDSPFFPTDLWLVDANTFWSLLWNPLFPYSLTLIVLFMDSLDRGTTEANPTRLWVCGLCMGLLALIHPYPVPLLLLMTGLISVLRGRKDAWKYLWRPYAVAFPFVLYVLLVSALDPLVARHNTLGEMKSPSPLSYLLGFGAPFLLAAAGLVMEKRNFIHRHWPHLLWVILSFLFSYLPFWFQRKCIFAAHVPICILAGISLDLLAAKARSWRTPRWIVGGAAVALTLLLVSTPVYELIQQRQQVRENSDGGYYVQNDVIAGLQFLKDHSNPDDIVFATVQTSRLIPAFAGNTVVWGHWAMSVDFRERTEWANRVFHPPSGWDTNRRAREFWDAGIQYIFVEGELKQWFDQTHPTWLIEGTGKAFENSSVTVYGPRIGRAQPVQSLR